MKRKLALIIALVLLALCLCSCVEPKKEPGKHNDLEIAYESISSAQLVSEMGIGWNLGITLDAPDGETSWGQPETTKEMIDKIKELGFNSIRIPVSWGKHVDEDFKIDKDWIRRVQDVVDYAIDNDMYVIINSHNDNDYYYPTLTNDEEQGERFITEIWTQVAEYFKDYDQHLIFEAMNEPRLAGTAWEWAIDIEHKRCIRAMEIINKYNQLFVNIVRASGGRNADRFLMVSCYSGNPSYAMIDEYVLPTDTVQDRILISAHFYAPYDLAMNPDLEKNTLTHTGKADIDYGLNNLYNYYVSKGIQVVLTEMGCINKNNPDVRYEWAEYYVSKAKELGIVCMLWDNGRGDEAGEETFGMFDRRNLKVFDSAQTLYQGLMDGFNGVE